MTLTAHPITREATPESLGVVIVSALAEAMRVDPLDLDPIYDIVGADAAESLFASPATAFPWPAVLKFRFDGHSVCVYDSELVEVWPHRAAAETANDGSRSDGPGRATTSERRDDQSADAY